MALKLFSRRSGDAKNLRVCRPPEPVMEPYEPAEAVRLEQDQLRRELQLERYAHILRSRHAWADHPELEAIQEAAENAIDEHFALVPEGLAACQQTLNDENADTETQIDPFLLARHTVTHEQFQHFAD